MKNLLREKREELYPDMSISAFCRSIGIKDGSYWNWENGVGATCYSQNNALTARKVCDALGISDAELKESISNNYQARKAGKMEKMNSIKSNKKRKTNNALLDWRISEGLTTIEVADILDITDATYCYWENGEHKPSTDNLRKLIELTGLSMHQIAQIYVDAHKIIDPEKDILVMDVHDDETVAPESTDPVYDEDYFEMIEGEEITAYDGNGKAIAGRYPLQPSADEILIDKALHELYGKLTCEEYNRIKDILGGALI